MPQNQGTENETKTARGVESEVGVGRQLGIKGTAAGGERLESQTCWQVRCRRPQQDDGIELMAVCFLYPSRPFPCTHLGELAAD